MRGLSIADSTSVLSKFPSLLEVESYIQVPYLEYRNIQLSILSHYQMLRKRLNHEHRPEIINEKRRSKYDEAPISKHRKIFKMKKKNLGKEN